MGWLQAMAVLEFLAAPARAGRVPGGHGLGPATAVRRLLRSFPGLSNRSLRRNITGAEDGGLTWADQFSILGRMELDIQEPDKLFGEFE